MDPDAQLRREFENASFHDLNAHVRVEREFDEWSENDDYDESDSDLEVVDVVQLPSAKDKVPVKRAYRELPSDPAELSLQEQMMLRMVSKMEPQNRTYTVVETLFQGYDPDQVLEALEDLIE